MKDEIGEGIHDAITELTHTVHEGLGGLPDTSMIPVELAALNGHLALLNQTLVRIEQHLARQQDELHRPKLTETLVQFDPADFERHD